MQLPLHIRTQMSEDDDEVIPDAHTYSRIPASSHRVEARVASLIHTIKQLRWQTTSFPPFRRGELHLTVSLFQNPYQARPCSLEAPRYLDTDLSICADSLAHVYTLNRVFVYLAGYSEGERHLPLSYVTGT